MKHSFGEDEAWGSEWNWRLPKPFALRFFAIKVGNFGFWGFNGDLSFCGCNSGIETRTRLSHVWVKMIMVFDNIY